MLVPEALMATLRGLGLVAGEAQDEPPAASTDGADAPARPGLPVVSAGLFLAQECNMRCVYCYGNAGTFAGAGLMDRGTALRAVDWLLENSLGEERVAISFFGGEPLLNFPLLREIVPYARQEAARRGKAVDFSVTTNGALLTDEVIAFIREEQVQPMISFDGPPEVQDSQRPFKDGSGSHGVVAANARKLRAVLPGLAARATLHGDGDPLRIRQGVLEAGFTACLLATESPVLLNGPPGDAGAETGAERRLEGMRALHRLEAGELSDLIRRRGIDKDLPPFSLGGLHGLVTGEKRHYGCGVGKGMVGIAVNGDIYPCHRFAGLADMRLGNIADYRAGALNDYHRGVVDSLPACRACWARYLCGGGCLYHNMACTGDMRRPSPPDCRERRHQFESMIHVRCGLDEADKDYVRGLLEAGPPGDRRPCGRAGQA